MGIEIVPHGDDKRALVETFNRRMYAGGASLGFYVDPEPRWIPKREGQKVWREFHLAIEDRSAVVGAFALKPQEWSIGGRRHVVADWQGPFSLGVVDKRYTRLGFGMMRSMLARQPLLYSWGHGGSDQPIVDMIRRMKWLVLTTPFLFRVVKPARFLRRNAQLRDRPWKALAQDALAFSGLGALGVHGLHAAIRGASLERFSADAERVDELGDWANAIWERARASYHALAVRDAECMNVLVPRDHRTDEWPAPVRLRVRKAGRDIGWAIVLEKQLERDPRFGDLTVGMIADYLAVPGDAGEVVHAAFAHLREAGVDMVIANQAHPAWIAAFVHNGFVAIPNKRLFCASPKLEEALGPRERVRRGILLSNLDGHGPTL